jgi:transcriptional regulator with GAF, ATPase, and Fis domain
MQNEHALSALARASAGLVLEEDTAGLLIALVGDCQKVLRVDATGVMVGRGGASLQLLAASTHQSAELELHQAQIEQGPCIDAADGNSTVAVAGDAELRSRWPQFGPAMIAAGYHAVHSAPLRWRGSTIGAMGLFRHDTEPFDADEDAVAQTFADLASLMIIRQDPEQGLSIEEQISAALSVRVVIEQAKGIIAYTGDVPMHEAYDILLRLTKDGDGSITATAGRLVAQARTGRVELFRDGS